MAKLGVCIGVALSGAFFGAIFPQMLACALVFFIGMVAAVITWS
jgi:hypothetical protein